MAAAVMAVQAHHNQISFQGNRRRSTDSHDGASDELVIHCTKKLPAKETWILDGVAEKRVVQIELQWHVRQVVLTDKHFFVTRELSDDVIEQIDLLEVEAPCLLQDAPDFYGRRGSGDADIILHAKVDHSSVETEKPAFVFKVRDGSGNKRRYCFGMKTKGEAERWINSLKQACKAARDQDRKAHYGKWIIHKTHKFYHSPKSQFLLALVIISNFVVSIVKAQLIPDGTGPLAEQLEILDYVYTGFFIIELIINMIANWFLPFWMDWWNLFDVVIVLISILSIPLSNVKGFSLLRMMRVFRVVKLFQSLKSLRTIITALTKAIIPVANAFMVLAIITAIYSVVGVGLFSEIDPIAFGDFSASLFTMFQVCTGDGWASSIARPMFIAIGGDDPHQPKASITLFFVSYILIVGTFLLNVVVAVLLDEFISAVQSGKAESRMLAQNQKKHNTALDPLLATFATCENSNDLKARIKQVYQVLDGDDSGGLSFEEMKDGLRSRLQTDPIIYLAPENYDSMTESGTLCNAQGELDLESFEVVMRKQLDLYAQRRAAFEMAEAEHSQSTAAAILLLLKQLMLTREEKEEVKFNRHRRKSIEQKSMQNLFQGSAANLFDNHTRAPSPDRQGPHGAPPNGATPFQGNNYRQRRKSINELEWCRDPSPRGRELHISEGDDDSVADRRLYFADNMRSTNGPAEPFSGEGSRRSVLVDHHAAEDVARLEKSVRDVQSKMDYIQQNMSELMQMVHEGFANSRQQREGAPFHGLNGGAANYNGIGRKLDEDKELQLIALQEVQQKLSKLESRIGSFEGLQRSVGTKVLNRVQQLEQKFESMHRGLSKLAKGSVESAPATPKPEQPAQEESSPKEKSGKEATAAGGTKKPRGWKGQGRGTLVAPPAALEISVMEEAYYDDNSQFVGAAATQLLLAGMEQSKGGSNTARGKRGAAMSADAERKSSIRMGKDGPLITAELGYDTSPRTASASTGGSAPARHGQPPFVRRGGEDAGCPVKVSWACTPEGLPAMDGDGVVESTCTGCSRCSDGYLGVGCLICGDKMALVAGIDELGGAAIGGLELMVTKAQRILRKYGFMDKVVDPSRFVDSPYGDGRHWFRCFIIAKESRSLARLMST